MTHSIKIVGQMNTSFKNDLLSEGMISIHETLSQFSNNKFCIILLWVDCTDCFSFFFVDRARLWLWVSRLDFFIASGQQTMQRLPLNKMASSCNKLCLSPQCSGVKLWNDSILITSHHKNDTFASSNHLCLQSSLAYGLPRQSWLLEEKGQCHLQSPRMVQ